MNPAVVSHGYGAIGVAIALGRAKAPPGQPRVQYATLDTPRALRAGSVAALGDFEVYLFDF